MRRKAIYRGWQRYQQRCQILRAQLGFDKTPASRPATCIGCTNYHGRAYGQTRLTRTLLICGFHPYGWLQESPCPDWKEEERRQGDKENLPSA
ncbi:MAG: hypothetical protein HC820_04740 [Hydrococcus sp. RM1_1_31]|nr:hypothetical protein [Hydrococcus sp. RM1_1_31]